MNSSHEKVPYPPAYGEIYPVVPTAEMMAGPDMGWQPVGVGNAVVVTPQQPTVYVTQHPVTSMVLGNQSRVGLFPVKLQPCPHCQTESKTTIKQEPTLRTHLLALIMCAMCCCCCIPCVYMTDNMTKTANHFCENCKNYIGSYKRKLCE